MTEKPRSLRHDLRATERRLPTPSKVALQTNDWKSFDYDDLFEARNGKRLTKDDTSPGTTFCIGATERDNSVAQCVGRDALHPGGQLAVSHSASVAEAVHQSRPFWASDDVNVFYPEFDMSPEVAVFLTTLIRQKKYRYNFGRKWKLEVTKASTMRLLVKFDGTPHWSAMENTVRGCGAYVALGQFDTDI